MSFAVMAYAVSVPVLAAVLGSRRTDLAPGSDVGDGLATAHRELVDGLPPTRTEQNYVDAFELLCRMLGRLLPNSGLSPTDLGHFENVNAALAGYRLGFDLKQVVYGGIPVEHPVLGTSRRLGHVSAQTLDEAVKLTGGQAIRSDDALVDEALCNVESWLEIADARRLDIVGFLY